MTDIEERNITPLRDKLNIYQNIIKGEEGTITKIPLNFSIDLQYFINLDPDYVVDLLKDMKVINQDLQSDKCDDGKREKTYYTNLEKHNYYEEQLSIINSQVKNNENWTRFLSSLRRLIHFSKEITLIILKISQLD